VRLRGVIERRLLVNYRMDPQVAARLLPAPFRPKRVRGWAMAGICLIRLRIGGLRSENAAHRIAVEWEGGEGVYVPRRDTSSQLNRLAGRYVFPVVQRHARFDVVEGGGRFRVEMESDDGLSRIGVEGRVTDRLPAESVFESVDEASDFFRGGCVGYSPGRRVDRFDGVELCARDWRVEPLEVTRVFSSCFDGDATLIPHGSAGFDCALLMRDVAHEWRVAAPVPSACPAERLAQARAPADLASKNHWTAKGRASASAAHW